MTEKWSENNSLKEILEHSGKEMSLFFPTTLVDFVPEEYRSIPLSQWAEAFRMPWGLPFPLDDLFISAQLTDKAQELWDWVPLWEKGKLTLNSNDTHSVGLMVPKCQLEGTCPAVIVCPGGAYENLAFYNEGYKTAKRLEQAGYRTFVLNYRYSPNRYPLPQMDLTLAIKHVRANAEQYQIDPENLMILGYSAGGHLCASTVALRAEVEEKLMEALKDVRPDLAAAYREISVRPDKVCLCYPVISCLSENHEQSFQNLSGGDETLREHLSVEQQVDADYPKTFLWTCEDDSLVPPSNAVRMAKALEANGIAHLLRLYPQGEHGCALAEGTSAEGWVDEMLEFMK